MSIRPLWSSLQPQQCGDYRRDILDSVMVVTRELRQQTVMLRIEPYATPRAADSRDVPQWYRALVGDEKIETRCGVINPENPLYAECFGQFIRALGKRYDGNPDQKASRSSGHRSSAHAGAKGMDQQLTRPTAVAALVGAL